MDGLSLSPRALSLTCAAALVACGDSPAEAGGTDTETTGMGTTTALPGSTSRGDAAEAADAADQGASSGSGTRGAEGEGGDTDADTDTDGNGECAETCDANAGCNPTTSPPQCECRAGFTGDGITCTDVDECGDGTDDCNDAETCFNRPGSFTCCAVGLEDQDGDGTCTDVDECATGMACGTGELCTNTMGGFTCECGPGFTGNPGACASGGYAFITSSVHTPDFGGVAEGDAICQGLADAAGAPLSGRSFRAWLSANGDGPNNWTNAIDAPYIRVDGVQIADDFGDLTNGGIDNPLNVDESGATQAATIAWTGTRSGGQPDGDDCNDWTSAAGGFDGRTGSSDSSAAGWTSQTDSACDGLARLYCFERLSCQPGQVPSNGACVDGKLAFVTSTRVDADFGGLAAADGACQALADATPGMAGRSFKAWLSDSNEDAADRLAQSTQPYFRTDGRRIADDWGDLTDGNLDRSINRDETGTQVVDTGFGTLAVWTGTDVDGTTQSGVGNCSDWTDASAGSDGGVGLASAGNDEWTERAEPNCSLFAARFYCLEQ